MDPAVFLKLIPGKRSTYAYLAKSRREGDRVRTEMLVRFGAVTPPQIERLRQWLATDPLLPPRPEDLLHDLSNLRIRHSWGYGREALGHFLWWKSGLHQIVLEAMNGVPHKGRVEKLLELMVLNRLDLPLSKWGLLTRWLKVTAAPLFVGLTGALHENLFYRAMDHLWVRQDALETRTYRRIVLPLTRHPEIFYHDTTSTWFEGYRADLGAYSAYAPDHRSDRPRVKWGMVVTGEGLPVTFQVFPGNTKDDTTVRPMRDRLTRVFGVKEGIYVGDRGMKSDLEAKDLEDHGFRWVLAVRSTDHEEVLLQAKDAPMVAVSEKNEAREVTTDKGRFVVLMNEERRKEELATLERRLEEGRSILRTGRRKAGGMGHHELLKRVQEELSEAHLTDLFEVNVDEDTIAVLLSRMKKKVAFRKRWAGWWVLKTNTTLPVERVAQVYQELSIIEQDWRVVKGALDVRPIYHWLERRVGAHLLICELALLLTKLAELKVRAAGLKGEDGGPLTGAAALEAFDTVMANEAELPGTGLTRIVITDLDARQRQILQAVGLEPERFQGGWSRLL